MIDLMKYKKDLIKKAEDEYGSITPCIGKKTLFDCFTYNHYDQSLILWFNDRKGSTHTVSSIITELWQQNKME